MKRMFGILGSLVLGIALVAGLLFAPSVAFADATEAPWVSNFGGNGTGGYSTSHVVTTGDVALNVTLYAEPTYSESVTVTFDVSGSEWLTATPQAGWNEVTDTSLEWSGQLISGFVELVVRGTPVYGDSIYTATVASSDGVTATHEITVSRVYPELEISSSMFIGTSAGSITDTVVLTGEETVYPVVGVQTNRPVTVRVGFNGLVQGSPAVNPATGWDCYDSDGLGYCYWEGEVNGFQELVVETLAEVGFNTYAYNLYTVDSKGVTFFIESGYVDVHVNEAPLVPEDFVVNFGLNLPTGYVTTTTTITEGIDVYIIATVNSGRAVTEPLKVVVAPVGFSEEAEVAPNDDWFWASIAGSDLFTATHVGPFGAQEYVLKTQYPTGTHEISLNVFVGKMLISSQKVTLTVTEESVPPQGEWTHVYLPMVVMPPPAPQPNITAEVNAKTVGDISGSEITTTHEVHLVVSLYDLNQDRDETTVYGGVITITFPNLGINWKHQEPDTGWKCDNPEFSCIWSGKLDPDNGQQEIVLFGIPPVGTTNYSVQIEHDSFDAIKTVTVHRPF